VIFFTEYKIKISLHIFVFVLLLQDIAFIQDAVFFFLLVCVFCIESFVGKMAHILRWHTSTNYSVFLLI